MSLAHPWSHADPAVDSLQHDVMALAAQAGADQMSRSEFFDRLWQLAAVTAGQPDRRRPGAARFTPVPVPQLSEPWYCCAEPTEAQLVPPI